MHYFFYWTESLMWTVCERVSVSYKKFNHLFGKRYGPRSNDTNGLQKLIFAIFMNLKTPFEPIFRPCLISCLTWIIRFLLAVEQKPRNFCTEDDSLLDCPEMLRFSVRLVAAIYTLRSSRWYSFHESTIWIAWETSTGSTNNETKNRSSLN